MRQSHEFYSCFKERIWRKFANSNWLYVLWYNYEAVKTVNPFVWGIFHCLRSKCYFKKSGIVVLKLHLKIHASRSDLLILCSYTGIFANNEFFKINLLLKIVQGFTSVDTIYVSVSVMPLFCSQSKPMPLFKIRSFSKSSLIFNHSLQHPPVLKSKRAVLVLKFAWKFKIRLSNGTAPYLFHMYNRTRIKI